MAPADVQEAITVGATNMTAKFDEVTSSNDPDSLYKVHCVLPCRAGRVQAPDCTEASASPSHIEL